MSVKNAEQYLQNTGIYTFGIAAQSAIGVIKTSGTKAMKLVNLAGNAFLMQAEFPTHKILQLEENEK